MIDLTMLRVEELDGAAKAGVNGGAKPIRAIAPFPPVITLPVEPIIGEPVEAGISLGGDL